MLSLKNMSIHYGYVIVFCCCLIMGINVGLVISCAGIFYGSVSNDLGVTVGKLGLYISFLHLFSTLMLSVAGRLIDKYSARFLLTASSGLLGICFLSMSAFNTVWQFYIAGSVMGITMAFLLYLSFPTLINRWFRTKVGFFIGVCSAASGIGGIVFNPFGAYLITTYGWRTAYFVFGLIILLLVTPVLGIFLRNYPADIHQKPFGENKKKGLSTEMNGISYGQAVKSAVFYGLAVFAFLMISVSTLNLFLPNYATGIGYSLAQASMLASAVMLGVTIGKVALGIINDKSSLTGLAVTILCGMLGLFLLFIGKAGFIMLITGGFLFGWAYAGVTVETALLVRQVFGRRDYAKIYSNIAIALAAGGTLTAGGWGILADYTSFQFILGLGIIFLVISGVIGLYALKKREPQK